jgi:phage shock protein A
MQLEHAQLSARASELDRTLAGFERELDVCFASGEEELARGVVRRRLETQRLASLLVRRRQALQESSAALATQVEENRTRLESMRQKSELLAEEATVARGDESWGPSECSVRQEEVEVALLAEKQKRSRP